MWRKSTRPREKPSTCPARTKSAFRSDSTGARTTRAAVLEVSSQNFVRTARGKGIKGRVVTWRHLFRNALVPIVTMSGIQLGYLLGGTVIIEQIFILPGLGRLLVTAINERDFPVVQSVTMLFATAFVLVNLGVDVICALIDPRSRDR